MAEESEQAARNRRKLTEHLNKLRQGRFDASTGDDDVGAEAAGGGNAGAAAGDSAGPGAGGAAAGGAATGSRQDAWDAWKRTHRGRVHVMRERTVDPAEADYKLLGLKPGAPRPEVQKAFNALAKQHHPDVGGDTERFQELVAAYKRLTAKA